MCQFDNILISLDKFKFPGISFGTACSDYCRQSGKLKFWARSTLRVNSVKIQISATIANFRFRYEVHRNPRFLFPRVSRGELEFFLSYAVFAHQFV